MTDDQLPPGVFLKFGKLQVGATGRTADIAVVLFFATIFLGRLMALW